jgi:hypothetical protein
MFVVRSQLFEGNEIEKGAERAPLILLVGFTTFVYLLRFAFDPIFFFPGFCLPLETMV